MSTTPEESKAKHPSNQWRPHTVVPEFDFGDAEKDDAHDAEDEDGAD